jgi:hypothetical protein
MHIARMVLLSVLVLLVLAPACNAQMTWSNGVLGFYLSNAGNVRAGLSPYSGTTRDVARMTIVAAQSPTAVFDYNTDQNGSALQPAQRITVAGADTAFETLTDNSYSNTPPKIKVRIAVMTWKNGKYAIVRYRVINDSSVTMSLWVGAHILPYISATYGGETVKYHAPSKTGYYYRQGVAKYWGMRLLGKNPTSFRTMDWNTWSTDPGSEVTSDSMRYAVTATGGFDSLGTASADGSIMQLNAGQSTIAKGDSATLYYALVYGASLPEMVASVDSAVAKFGKVFTDVRPISSVVPEQISLSQNYPNPFNPSTRIEFSLPNRGWARVAVYDLIGRHIATLAEGTMNPGLYAADFSGEGLTSGVYIVRLETASTMQSRRMILLK